MELFKVAVNNEARFLSSLAWAYLSAYASILVGAYTEARLLASGVSIPPDALKAINRNPARDLL